MTEASWWALGVAGYLAAGVWTTYAVWRWCHRSEMLWELCFGCWGFVALTALCWWLILFMALMEGVVPLPRLPAPVSYEEWQERRREAAERRAQPSEAVPYREASD